jgi:hypothetical protein
MDGGIIHKRKYQRGWYVENHKAQKSVFTKSQENDESNIAIHSEQKETSQSSETQEPANDVAMYNEDNHSGKTDNEPIIIARTTVEKINSTLEKNHSTGEGEKKKKKRKEKVEPLISWGSFSVALSTWFKGWIGGLSALNIPVLAISLASVGIVLLVVGLIKLKKPKKKKRNLFIGIGSILLGIAVIVISLAA